MKNPEQYQPTSEEITSAEGHAEDYVLKDAQQLREHAETGEFDSRDIYFLDQIMRGAIMEGLSLNQRMEIWKYEDMDEEEKDRYEQENLQSSEVMQGLYDLLTDRQFLLRLKELALQMYEQEALESPNSNALFKLKAFADLAGDQELKDRFIMTVGEPYQEEGEGRTVTEDDKDFVAIGIPVGTKLGPAMVFPRPIWSYRESEN